MSEKPTTVAEVARMGGIARAKAHSKAELRACGKQGGRPPKMDRKARERLRKLLANGKNHVECASILGVSVRTIGRAVDRVKRGKNEL